MEKKRKSEEREKIKSVKFTSSIKRKINVASCARFTQGDHLQDSGPSRAFVETERLLIYGFPAPVKGEKARSARLRTFDVASNRRVKTNDR